MQQSKTTWGYQVQDVDSEPDGWLDARCDGPGRHTDDEDDVELVEKVAEAAPLIDV